MEFNATFLVSVISFLVFTFLMNKVFYAPISKIANERQSMIDALVRDTNSSNDEAAKLNAEKEEKLFKSSEETRKIIADKVEKANKRADVLTLNAKNASIEEIAIKKEELSKSETEVREQLDDITKTLAADIVSKVLG